MATKYICEIETPVWMLEGVIRVAKDQHSREGDNLHLQDHQYCHKYL
jgi:hypothetical protein